VAVAFGGTGATDAGTARSNLGTNDAANITTGTLSSSRLPSSGINASAITTGTLAVAQGGTGGLLPVANGGTGTATPSLVAGSGITVTGSFPNQTIAATGGGTVTSVATGNGLQGGTITTTGTLSITAPSYTSVGSYMVLQKGSGNPVAVNVNYSGSNCNILGTDACGGGAGYGTAPGTWRSLGAIYGSSAQYLGVRIS
jgi:hypothetical protein